VYLSFFATDIIPLLFVMSSTAQHIIGLPSSAIILVHKVSERVVPHFNALARGDPLPISP